MKKALFYGLSFFLIVIIVACTKSITNNESKENHQHEHYKTSTLGESHNNLCDKVYKRLLLDYSNGKFITKENSDFYIPSMLYETVKAEYSIIDSAEFVLLTNNNYVDFDYNGNLTSVVDSINIGLSNIYSENLIEYEEYIVLQEVLNVIYNYDNNFLTDIYSIRDSLNVYGKDFKIAASVIDVAISSHNYWQSNFSNWESLLTNMVQNDSKQSRIVAGGAIIAMDAYSVGFQVVQCTAEGCGEGACTVHVIIAGALGSCFSPLTSFIPWHDWF